MYDADALEAINGEQLVTATDRLLLRGGQLSRRRHIRRLAEGSQPHIVIARFAEGSQPDLPNGSVGCVAEAAARASRLAPRARSVDAGDRTQIELTSDQVGDSTQVDLVADFAIDVEPDVATDDLVDRTQPDRRLACAWEITVPHPLSRRVVAQPYAATIVAAPFATVPHPLPPARDSSVEYVMCALRLPALDDELHPQSHVEYVAVSDTEPRRCHAPSGLLAAVKGSLVTTSHASLAFIAAAPFAADSYPALHGRPSLPSLEDITGPLPAGFDPSSVSRERAAQLEPTAVVRCPKVTGAQVLALTVIVPALVGIAVGLAALL